MKLLSLFLLFVHQIVPLILMVINFIETHLILYIKTIPPSCLLLLWDFNFLKDFIRQTKFNFKQSINFFLNKKRWSPPLKKEKKFSITTKTFFIIIIVSVMTVSFNSSIKLIPPSFSTPKKNFYLFYSLKPITIIIFSLLFFSSLLFNLPN